MRVVVLSVTILAHSLTTACSAQRSSSTVSAPDPPSPTPECQIFDRFIPTMVLAKHGVHTKCMVGLVIDLSPTGAFHIDWGASQCPLTAERQSSLDAANEELAKGDGPPTGLPCMIREEPEIHPK